MTNFTHAKYGPDTVRIDDPTYVVPLLTEDVTVGTGLAFPAADTVAIEAGGVEKARFTSTLNSLAGVTKVLANSASAALTVTQTGAGNAFVVEDVASPDATPFVIEGSGALIVGHTATLSIQSSSYLGEFLGSGSNYPLAAGYTGASTTGPRFALVKNRSAAWGTHTVVNSGDTIGQIDFDGSDGTNFLPVARIEALVDGTPGTNDMPGRLVFSTTADGSSSPTEAMRIDSTQSITSLASGSGTNAYGFRVTSAKIGGTNNYAFSGEIAAGPNRYNFYAPGTAANYFAGDVQLGKVVTAGGTTGAQTINKTVGTVNFAAAATSLVVTNNLVTTSSIITATVGTNDTTMKSVAVVAAAGSFTLHANAAATAETRVNFHVFN